MVTRERLADAAERIIRERGIGAVTTKEVARETGIGAVTTKEVARETGLAEATRYRHFADKTALLLAVFGERDGRRWLVSPYGEVDWVRNLRAAGGGTLTRGRYTLRFTATALGPQEAAPVIKASVTGAPGFIRKYFATDPAAPLPAFARIAAKHPVFELQAV